MEWLRSLLAADGPVAIKETRFYSKVDELAELDPGAALVHVVRDPRAVAASIVLGRGRRQEEKLPTADDFFADRSKRKLWSCRPISRRMINKGLAAGADAAALDDPSNVLRVLLVWRLTFERTLRDGRARFGDRYLLVRNEELRSDPVGRSGADLRGGGPRDAGGGLGLGDARRCASPSRSTPRTTRAGRRSWPTPASTTRCSPRPAIPLSPTGTLER